MWGFGLEAQEWRWGGGSGEDWSAVQPLIRKILALCKPAGVMEYWSDGKIKGTFDLIRRIFIKDAEEFENLDTRAY